MTDIWLRHLPDINRKSHYFNHRNSVCNGKAYDIIIIAKN